MNETIIMVLAGSYWQIPIIKKIKAMGYKSLVVNLYEDSPAFAYADYFEVVDILDKEQCLLIAKKYAVKGVLSEECDIAMPTVAYVAESLNLPSLGSDFAALYTNKYQMRRFCEKHKFSYPEFALCYNLQEAEEFFLNLNKTIIIKPLDSSSSRGVFKISSIEELHKHFLGSLSFSKTQKAILAERFIKGTEFTVDGIMIQNKHYSLAISKKGHYEHNVNIANQLFFSYCDDDFDYDELRKVNDALIETSGLPDGCLTHSEYKFEDGSYFLIETAARGGGNLISADIVPLLTGFDNYKYLVNRTLGISNIRVKNIVNEELKQRCAVLYFFDTPSKEGIVREVKGIDYLENSPNVVQYKLNFKIGDRIEKAKNDAARIGFYIAYAETRKELLDIMDNINNNFKIEIV